MQERLLRPLQPLAGVVRPLQQFLHTESAGGVLLLIAAVAALVWANLPGQSYTDLWDTHLRFDLRFVDLDYSLRHWVNDGLMAIFFFVVGLEIKRELLRGELAERKRAALPVAGAIGGMVVPAAIFLALNAGGDGQRGWGIPMATDIAFAVGVLSLLGSRVPTSLKVFLLALAIVDDLGAISIIAIFYTDDLSVAWLAAGAGFLGATVLVGQARIRSLWVYVTLGLGAWLCIHESGVHATIAGVALGLLTPIEPHFNSGELEAEQARLMEDYRRGSAEGTREGIALRDAALAELEELARDSRSVLARLEQTLHPWSSFVIVPLFALANAGIDLGGGVIADATRSPISSGVLLGLVVGKPLGITIVSFLAVRAGVATLPAGVGWASIAATGALAGIGFTVAIFIANLAFDDQALIDEAKIAILAASVISAVVGYTALRVIMARGSVPIDQR
jgi:NhaA family Na+:H+ antiporter